MKHSAHHWKETIAAATAKVDSDCQNHGIPILRGRFFGDKASLVIVDVLNWDSIHTLLEEGSICVVDFRVPPAPINKDADLRDLHVYLRLGRTDTWIYYALETPEDDDPNDIPEDEIDHSWRQPYSVDQDTMNILAMRVARDVGFGSLRNKSERAEFTRSSLNDSTKNKLLHHDFWAISTLADTFYRTGVAPTTAKLLDSQGKSLPEISRAMGISQSRVCSALETNVPRHIAKLIASQQ